MWWFQSVLHLHPENWGRFPSFWLTCLKVPPSDSMCVFEILCLHCSVEGLKTMTWSIAWKLGLNQKSYVSSANYLHGGSADWFWNKACKRASSTRRTSCWWRIQFSLWNSWSFGRRSLGRSSAPKIPVTTVLGQRPSEQEFWYSTKFS